MLHSITEQGLGVWGKGQSWKAKIRSFNLDAAQVDAVEDCMLYAVDLHAQLTNVEAHIEERVYIAKDCDGTADLVFVSDECVDVIDWKFGQGIEVSAIDNTQLMAYACGVIKGKFLDKAPSLKVRLHVVQPRINNYSTFETTVGDLMWWHEHVLKPGLSLAESELAPFNPSLSACRWCPRRSNCTARMQAALNNAETVFAQHAQMPNLDADLLEKLLPMASEIEACIKDLKLFATQQLSDGKTVKGFKLVRGRSNRVWVDEEAAGEFLSQHLDPEEQFNVKMIGPAAAEKLLDRQLRKEDDFLGLIDKPEGKLTLAAESDKRQAVSQGAEAVFASCTNPNS